MCRAYNRWLADYCHPYPDRLFGVAMLPMQSIELAIEEMRFARKELGMRGGFLRPNPYNGRMLHHPDYEPFWEEVEELDFSIGLHEGASGGMPQVGVDRFETRGARHIISHTMEMMLAAMSVIWGGVCDRHPRVRIAFLESGGGWIAPWLDRMDRHFEDQGFNDSELTMRPSELFQRNCWISFEPVEGSLSVLADYIGPHKILWATDYPHPDGFFPGAPKLIADRPELSAETKRADPGRRRDGLLQAGGRAMKFGLHCVNLHGCAHPDTAARLGTRRRGRRLRVALGGRPRRPAGSAGARTADGARSAPARSDRLPHLPRRAHRRASCSAPA